MSQPIRVGVVLRFKNPAPWRISWEQLYREHLEYAAAADRLGFDGIWVAEHHCIDSGYNPTPFVSLAAIAGVTTKAKLGTQPLVLPLHNPVLAAEQAAVVDVLSGGRLILGMGAGFRDGDFEAVGIDRKERGGRSEEALSIITRAMRGEAFDYQGKFYNVKGVKLSPSPVQTNPEFQLAVRSKVVAARAVRHKIDVNLQSREEAVVHGPIVAEMALAAGIDPKTIRASIQKHAGFIAGGRNEAVEISKPYLRFQMEEYLVNAGGDAAVVAHANRMIESVENGEGPFTSQEWIDVLNDDAEAVRATGLTPDWLNVTLWHSGMPVSQAIDALEAFAEGVLPNLNRAKAAS